MITPSFQFAGIAAAIALAAGIVGGWKLGSTHYRTKYETILAEDWKNKASGEEAARKAIEAQLEAAHATITRNTGITNDLEQKAAATAAERDRYRAALDRLRAAPARPTPGSSSVPEGDHRPTVDEVRQTASLRECQGLLIENVADGADNADSLDALSSAIKPQIAPP